MSRTTDSPVLQDNQKFALIKFRRSVADVIKPEHDDYYLIRWLQARKWNPEAAEKMLRNSFKTRAMWDVDNLDKWDIPRALIDYVPTGHVGYDNEGSPVLIYTHYGLDLWGLLHCITKFDFQKYMYLLCDRYMKAGYESSKKHGPQARQLVILMDVANFNLKQYAWRPAVDLIITMVKEFEANYPEVLKMVYIINVPKLFMVLHNVVVKFLDEKTISKLKIFKNGSDKWQGQLFSHVDPETFPKCFGGNYVDENGDPNCNSMICYGGKIPKQLYTHHSDDNNNNKNYVETIINRGKKLKLKFDVPEESKERLLTWEFRTTNYDIKFGIYSIDNKTGDKHDEIPLGTVYSNEMDEIGFINCRPDSTYFALFDNTSSYFRNKKIRYCVELLADLKDVHELTESVKDTSISEKN